MSEEAGGEGEARICATVSVTIDNEREVEAVNAWFRRWGPRLRFADNRGCGCCVDIWDIEAPQAAWRDLPQPLWARRPAE